MLLYFMLNSCWCFPQCLLNEGDGIKRALPERDRAMNLGIRLGDQRRPMHGKITIRTYHKSDQYACANHSDGMMTYICHGQFTASCVDYTIFAMEHRGYGSYHTRNPCGSLFIRSKWVILEVIVTDFIPFPHDDGVKWCVPTCITTHSCTQSIITYV